MKLYMDWAETWDLLFRSFLVFIFFGLLWFLFGLAGYYDKHQQHGESASGVLGGRHFFTSVSRNLS